MTSCIDWREEQNISYKSMEGPSKKTVSGVVGLHG